MSWQNLSKWAKSDYLKLVPILGLAFYLAFLHHLNYPYPDSDNDESYGESLVGFRVGGHFRGKKSLTRRLVSLLFPVPDTSRRL
jgi:hypothetical protein